MQYSIALIIVFFAAKLGWSQQVEVIQPPEQPDSSYYDIFRVGPNEFWAAGENGVLVTLDTVGNHAPVSYPSVGVDILKIDRLSENELILVGKAGTVYHYNQASDEWRVQRVPGYEKKVFYETAVVDENTFLLGGGMSKIADSKVTLPRGFILMTRDKGQTWEKVYSHPLAMIWDVDRTAGGFMALMFNPFSRKRLLHSTDGIDWKVSDTKVKGLFHDYDADADLLAGGEKMNMKGRGMLVRSADISLEPATPFWWSTASVGPNTVASGSNGTLLVTRGDTAKVIQTDMSVHFYELAPISNATFFVAGRHQSILKITLNGSDLVFTR